MKERLLRAHLLADKQLTGPGIGEPFYFLQSCGHVYVAHAPVTTAHHAHANTLNDLSGSFSKRYERRRGICWEAEEEEEGEKERRRKKGFRENGREIRESWSDDQNISYT